LYEKILSLFTKLPKIGKTLMLLQRPKIQKKDYPAIKVAFVKAFVSANYAEKQMEEILLKRGSLVTLSKLSFSICWV